MIYARDQCLWRWVEWIYGKDQWDLRLSRADLEPIQAINNARRNLMFRRQMPRPLIPSLLHAKIAGHALHGPRDPGGSLQEPSLTRRRDPGRSARPCASTLHRSPYRLGRFDRN